MRFVSSTQHAWQCSCCPVLCHLWYSTFGPKNYNTDIVLKPLAIALFDFLHAMIDYYCSCLGFAQSCVSIQNEIILPLIFIFIVSFRISPFKDPRLVL
jgi:hypothetical protein